MWELVILSIFALCAVSYFLYVKWSETKENYQKLDKLYQEDCRKYHDIIDIDAEIEKKQEELKQYEEDIKISKNDANIVDAHLEELLAKKKELDNDLLALDCGLYTPHFDFDTSERYKVSLLSNRQTQKQMISSWVAIKTSFDLKSRKKDVRIDAAKKVAKLMLRAFNGEADSIIADVRWNNVLKMVERLQKVFNDVNSMAFDDVAISEDYLKLKTEDLYLTFEYEKKKYEEKEEQRRIREQMREEEKVRKEQEKRQQELEEQEKQEAELKRLLDEAYNNGRTAEAEKLNEEISKLNEIIENNKKAISNAQLTKWGRIYVISNIGSFGETVYKIGMTRRDDPMERVNELGDASVPFKFDVHAIIESDNAPELENKLHEIFKLKSVNRVNYRKEFFRVSLEEIEEVVKELGYDIEFTKVAEAREYRETLSILESEKQLA